MMFHNKIHVEKICSFHGDLMCCILLCCVPFVVDAMIYFGDEAIWRENEDFSKRGTMIADPSVSFKEKSGVIVGWNVYTTRGRRSQVVMLQIWRKVKDLEYERVGETNITALWVGHNYFLLHPEDRIFISRGDVLGLHFPGYNPVPWSPEQFTGNNVHLFNYDGIAAKLKFQQNSAANDPCRKYSFNATIMNYQELSEFDNDYDQSRDGRYYRRPYGRHLAIYKRYNDQGEALKMGKLIYLLFMLLSSTTIYITHH